MHTKIQDANFNAIKAGELEQSYRTFFTPKNKEISEDPVQGFHICSAYDDNVRVTASDRTVLVQKQ